MSAPVPPPCLHDLDVERRFLPEDRLLELPQPVAGLDPELVDERAAGFLVTLQRLRLATGAVEREHELATEPLA